MNAILDSEQNSAKSPMSTFAPRFTIVGEAREHELAREALLDRAMGEGRRRKSSEKLRRGRLPADGLAFSAIDETGALIGTVRLWNVQAGSIDALLLGPLAVDKMSAGKGIGSALMAHAIAETRRLGHGAILLVGDPEYYQRFGFSAEKTGNLSMPGPYEKRRFLALELKSGHLDHAEGILRASGRKATRPEQILRKIA